MSDEIRIGQMSDLHLGYRQYGKFTRVTDFYNAALDAAELLIESDVDFVVVPGDIFHRARPYPIDQRHAIKIFSRFQKAGIPVFAIRGNHDASYAWSERQGGNELHVFEDLELVTLLEDEYMEYEISSGQKVRIWGMGYHGNTAMKKLNKLVEDKETLFDEDIPNILLLHEFLENLMKSAKLNEYSLDLLGFDFISIGHYHGWWVNDNQSICSSGSTEHVSAAEWDEPERSVALITLKRESSKWTPSITRLKYPVRPKIRKQLDFGVTTIDEVKEKVLELIEELDQKDTIVRIDVTGTISDSPESPNVGELCSHAVNVFHISLDSDFDYGGLPIRENITDNEVMVDVFKERFGISDSSVDDWVDLAKSMKELLIGSQDERSEETQLDILYKFAEKVSSKDLEGAIE
ncbi:MAG: hypothetical protein BAJATHORv1_40339 [Candidatus Thorarchaeota archaeon]|nr:MAG: hypothetical protein BAJATHORv1_40339 [Candidatus Thorarchaeota archaeon]